MIGFDEQIELFNFLGGKIKRKIECIAVGGSAMLFYNLKSATKDVDLIFLSGRDREEFARILLKSGFTKKQFREKSKKRVPVVWERKDTRFDLFKNGVFHFRLSPGMKGRIREKHEFKNFIVGIISPEDIILLKSVTDRAGDRLDVKSIIDKMNIKWETVIKESMWQTENGEKAFTVYLFDFLEELKEELKAEIPKEIIKKVRKISEKEMLKILGKRK
jgi:hypothetical protein